MNGWFKSIVAWVIPFDNTGTDYAADNVQDALVEAGRRGFSVRFVTQDLRIYDYEEMILSDYIDVSSTASVDVDGLLTILGV